MFKFQYNLHACVYTCVQDWIVIAVIIQLTCEPDEGLVIAIFHFSNYFISLIIPSILLQGAFL